MPCDQTGSCGKRIPLGEPATGSRPKFLLASARLDFRAGVRVISQPNEISQIAAQSMHTDQVCGIELFSVRWRIWLCGEYGWRIWPPGLDHCYVR